MTKPISPNDIASFKAKTFPPEVFEAFNELIAKNFSAGSADVKQKHASALIASKLNITSSEVFDKGYLNVEEVYRAEGWKVNYDKPAYCENYDAFFTFKAK